MNYIQSYMSNRGSTPLANAPESGKVLINSRVPGVRTNRDLLISAEHPRTVMIAPSTRPMPIPNYGATQPSMYTTYEPSLPGTPIPGTNAQVGYRAGMLVPDKSAVRDQAFPAQKYTTTIPK